MQNRVSVGNQGGETPHLMPFGPSMPLRAALPAHSWDFKNIMMCFFPCNILICLNSPRDGLTGDEFFPAAKAIKPNHQAPRAQGSTSVT